MKGYSAMYFHENGDREQDATAWDTESIPTLLYQFFPMISVHILIEPLNGGMDNIECRWFHLKLVCTSNAGLLQ